MRKFSDYEIWIYHRKLCGGGIKGGGIYAFNWKG